MAPLPTQRTQACSDCLFHIVVAGEAVDGTLRRTTAEFLLETHWRANYPDAEIVEVTHDADGKKLS